MNFKEIFIQPKERILEGLKNKEQEERTTNKNNYNEHNHRRNNITPRQELILLSKEHTQ